QRNLKPVLQRPIETARALPLVHITANIRRLAMQKP
ncbi:MAG: hypothetical protein ACI9BH_002315, partial [Paracoccaceae bacterium]